MSLTEQQIERYSRQIILKEIGGAGQERLCSSKVLIVGAGGLGSPVALYLAAAGVGTIGIADGDLVDLTNLQRQIVHSTEDVGVPKIDSAAASIGALNPDVEVNLHNGRLEAANIRQVIRSYDFVIDGTDNFSAKFLINDACYMERVAFSHAGILRFQGQLMTVLPHRTACYRCIFDSPPPAGVVSSCSQAGILGALAGVIGSLQATEALKYLLGLEGLLTDALLTFDALEMNFRKIELRRNPACRLCSDDPEITELKDDGLADTQVCDMTKGCCDGK